MDKPIKLKCQEDCPTDISEFQAQHNLPENRDSAYDEPDGGFLRWLRSLRHSYEVARSFSSREQLIFSDAEEEEMWRNHERFERFMASGGKLRSLSLRLCHTPMSKGRSFSPFYEWRLPRFSLWRLFSVKRQKADVTDVRSMQIVETQSCPDGLIILATLVLYHAPLGTTKESLVFGDQRVTVEIEKCLPDPTLLYVTCASKYLPEVATVILVGVSLLLGYLFAPFRWLRNKIANIPASVSESVALAATVILAVVFAWPRTRQQILALLPIGSNAIEQRAIPQTPATEEKATISTFVLGPGQQAVVGDNKPVLTPGATANSVTGKPRAVGTTTSEYRKAAKQPSTPPPIARPEGASKFLEASPPQYPAVEDFWLAARELANAEEQPPSPYVRVEDLKLKVSMLAAEGSLALAVKIRLYHRGDFIGDLRVVKIPWDEGGHHRRLLAGEVAWQEVEYELKKNLRQSAGIADRIWANIWEIIRSKFDVMSE